MPIGGARGTTRTCTRTHTAFRHGLPATGNSLRGSEGSMPGKTRGNAIEEALVSPPYTLTT